MKINLSLFVAIIAALFLTSCMHIMMLGGHGDHDEHQATVITKEVVNGDNNLSASIEPMTAGKEGKIILSLRSKLNVPESLSVHYMISKASAAGNTSGHNHNESSASNEEFKTIHQNIILNNGTSAIAFTPTNAGSFVLTVETGKIPNSDSTLSLDVNFMVHDMKSKGMMGMGGMWDYPVLGIFVMGTMVVGMVLIRGGI